MKNVPWDESMQLALRVHFVYDPDMGLVMRRIATRRTRNAVLNSRTARGAIQTNFLWEKKLWNLQAHRLAYFLHTGKQPQEILHKDRDKSNNKFSNLIAIFDSATMVAEGMKDLKPFVAPEATTTAVLPPNPIVQLEPLAAPSAQIMADVDMNKWGEVLIGKYAIVSPIGGILSPVWGEILPDSYDYYSQSRAEKQRVRLGWAIWAYFEKPNEFGITKAEKDKEDMLPERYSKADQIKPQNARWGGRKPFELNLDPATVELQEGKLSEAVLAEKYTAEFKAILQADNAQGS